ncbi:MAG: proteasome subunit beta [Acidimicrobiales bacterium]
MPLYLFPPTEDPGPSFVELLRRARPDISLPDRSQLPFDARLATTICALKFSSGVVVAGDRRATEGISIAHRAIEKVFPADRYSAVAIAGVAGPAIEMVRLFQTQLEHYEKVEGEVLTLEGKANQLAQLVRENLPMAMQGLGVLPLFAGWDARRGTGRIFTYDMTGGRYEETEFHAVGSGGRDAKNTIKLGFRDDLVRDEAVELAVDALYQAADEDAATGGPDPVRGIYPIIATVDETGFTKLADSEVAERFSSLLSRRGENGAGGSRS